MSILRVNERFAMGTYHHGNLREALLERAANVIEESGLEALSLRALARDLGVSSTAPARHFKTRTDLIQALAQEGFRQLTTRVLAQDIDDLAARPNLMAKAFIYWSQENPALFLAIMHPDVTRQADKTLRTELENFSVMIWQALYDAQQTGWKQEIETDILFEYMLAAVRGLALNMSDQLYRDVRGNIDGTRLEAVINLLLPA